MGSFVSVQKIAAKKIGVSYEEYLKRIIIEKWCTCCKIWVNRIEFGIDNSRGDGLKAKCNGCVRVKEKKSTKGRVSTFKGKHHTEENKRKASERMQGFKSPMDGKNHTLESRIKMSESKRDKSPKGKDCHFYKDGKVEERRGIRFSKEYKRWRFDVFVRDNFTCQNKNCGDNKGGNLNAHHIKSFADFPELRFDVDNGITLCEDCHKDEHKKK